MARNNNHSGKAAERARVAVRELTGSKVSNQSQFDRISRLRDIGWDDRADELEQQQGQGWGL